MFRFNRYNQNQNTGFASANAEAGSACRPSDNKTAFIIIMDAIIVASFSIIIAVLNQAVVGLLILVLLVYLVFIAAALNMTGLKRTHYCY